MLLVDNEIAFYQVSKTIIPPITTNRLKLSLLGLTHEETKWCLFTQRTVFNFLKEYNQSLLI